MIWEELKTLVTDYVGNEEAVDVLMSAIHDYADEGFVLAYKNGFKIGYAEGSE